MNTEAATQVESTLEVHSLKDACDGTRDDLKDIEDRCRALAADCFAKKNTEAGAQAMLAVRHIEDARMRVGKVIQYAVQGGVSILDGMHACAHDGCAVSMSAGAPRFCPDHNGENP